MKVIEVPVFNEDGSIKVTHLISPEEAQALLQFATNFLMASGMMATNLMPTEPPDPQMELPLTVQ